MGKIYTFLPEVYLLHLLANLVNSFFLVIDKVIFYAITEPGQSASGQSQAWSISMWPITAWLTRIPMLTPF
jgi:hypothetical protein